MHYLIQLSIYDSFSSQKLAFYYTISIEFIRPTVYERWEARPRYEALGQLPFLGTQKHLSANRFTAFTRAALDNSQAVVNTDLQVSGGKALPLHWIE